MGGRASLKRPWDSSLELDTLVPRPRRRRWLRLPASLRVELVHLHLELSQCVIGGSQGEVVG